MRQFIKRPGNKSHTVKIEGPSVSYLLLFFPKTTSIVQPFDNYINSTIPNWHVLSKTLRFQLWRERDKHSVWWEGNDVVRIPNM